MAVSAAAGIIRRISEPEWSNLRNVHNSPVVPNDQHPFVASSESVLRIMRNSRLPEMERTTSGGSGQRPYCLADIGDIGGANGR